MNPKLSFLFIVLLTLTISCSKEKIYSNSSIYFNSFENSSDISNLDGYGFMMSDGTPVNGGDSSLMVGGACIQPALFFELGPFDEDKILSFNTYAKMLEIEGVNWQGGRITLSLVNDRDKKIRIFISDLTWTYYQTENKLEVPSGEKIYIDFSIGGYSTHVALIDLFQIESE